MDEISEISEINEVSETNENILINNEDNTDTDINNDIIPRYEIILELLGLNKNINYPQSIILDGIIEMHTIKNKESQYNNYSRYARIYKFKNDKISKKIEKCIFSSTDLLFSYMSISRNIKRCFRTYTYNKIANKVLSNTIKNIDNDKNYNNELILGFNYHNPRWNTLTSYVIE